MANSMERNWPKTDLVAILREQADELWAAHHKLRNEIRAEGNEEQYLVFKFRYGRDHKYNIVALDGPGSLGRGLADWSYGRVVLDRDAAYKLLDIWTAHLTYEQYEAIRDDGAEPPPPQVWLPQT